MGKNLVRQALDRVGKNWSKSSHTREKLLGNVKDFTQFVGKKYGLEKIENLKSKMIHSYTQSLHERGLSASAMADKMTAVRQIASAIGKANIVERHNSAYGISRQRVNPQAVNQEKLAEVRHKISTLAAKGDEVAKMVLAADALREAFGLRAKESLMSKEVVGRHGKLYLQIEGAKGGRTRELEVKSESQIKAIQLLAETSKAMGSGTGRIIPPKMSLKQAYDAQRNLWRSLGGMRSAGANMHGERHAYARTMKDCGAAKSEIMIQLGHGEDRSPSAYLGKK